jgi:hypothetical protein
VVALAPLLSLQQWSRGVVLGNRFPPALFLCNAARGPRVAKATDQRTRSTLGNLRENLAAKRRDWMSRRSPCTCRQAGGRAGGLVSWRAGDVCVIWYFSHTTYLKNNRTQGVFDPSVRPLLAVPRDPAADRDMSGFIGWRLAGWQAGGRLTGAKLPLPPKIKCWLASRQTHTLTLTRSRPEGAGTHCLSAAGGPPRVEHQSAHPPPAGQQSPRCWWVSQRCSLPKYGQN